MADTGIRVCSGSVSSCGTERLLRDCALVGRMIETERASAWLRLAVKIGPELALHLTPVPPRPYRPGVA